MSLAEHADAARTARATNRRFIRRRTPEAVVARIARRVTDGAIVMLHDASEGDDFEPASVRALPALLRLLDERGWTSIGLDALLDPAEPAFRPTAARSASAIAAR